jgi:hypothetical protein
MSSKNKTINKPTDRPTDKPTLKTKVRQIRSRTAGTTINKKIPNFPMQKIKSIISKEDAREIRQLVKNFFENKILDKIKNCPRPVIQKHGDFVERNLGRFEITPTPLLKKQIWKRLLKNDTFVKINGETKDFLKKHHNSCKEELCLLPVQPNTKSGTWHRDIFVRSKKDFSMAPFYITQIIYLDDKAGTKFCIGSQNNLSDDHQLYDKKEFKATSLSSILFDGRMLHKGMGNNTNQTRYAIYISYYISSYVDKESIKKPVLNKEKLC